MVMGFILPMVRDLDGKRRYVHVEKKKKLRNFKSGGESAFYALLSQGRWCACSARRQQKREEGGASLCVSVSRDCTYCPSGWGCGCRCVARSESISVKKKHE